MKIKMKAIAAGPDGVFNLNQVYDLPEKQALSFIAGNYAVAYVAPAEGKAPAKGGSGSPKDPKAALKAAEEACEAARDALAKAKKEDKAEAAKALAAAKKALAAAQEEAEADK